MRLRRNFTLCQYAIRLWVFFYDDSINVCSAFNIGTRNSMRTVKNITTAHDNDRVRQVSIDNIFRVFSDIPNRWLQIVRATKPHHFIQEFERIQCYWRNRYTFGSTP